MTAYVFDQLAPEGAPLLQPSDAVIFHGGPARLATVAFGVAASGVFTATVSFGGHQVAFDPGIQTVSANRNLIFDDGSNLLIGSPGDEVIEGGDKDDALFGGDGADSLYGHAGDNLMQGNQGPDRLIADAGADTVLGGQGDDLIVAGLFGTGLDGVRFDPSAGQDAGNVVNGNLGDDSIAGGNGPDILLGGQGDDLVLGGGGADFLNGNLGDDRLYSDGASVMLGEGGADTLTARAQGAMMSGGDGPDLFAFVLPAAATITGAAATIVDWSPEDSIHFAQVAPAHAYAELTAADFSGALAAANGAIAASADPQRAGGEVVVVQVGGDLYAFVAGPSSAGADVAIQIVGRSLADIDAQDIV